MVTPTLYRRMLVPPKGSFFLFGPRGTGKSTWLRHSFPRAHTVNLLDEGLYQSYLGDPSRFARELRALPEKSLVIIDEVQRLPSLLNEVHRFIEERHFRFILCGSSAHKLKKSGTNLLAGRAAYRNMHALVPEEMESAFDLADALRWGTLPIIGAAPDRREALEAYVRMYLREEVQAEALVRNLPGFARFLPVAALFHGQVINVSGIARDAGVARSTILGYLEILENTLLTFPLPAFEAKLRVRERRHPKLYWADAGLPRALKRQFSLPGAEERGCLFEGWVASILRAYRDYRGLFEDWGYWASNPSSNLEVDFVLRRGDRLVALEVKATSKLSSKSYGGLRAIADLDGLARRCLVYLGEARMRTEDGIDVLPVRDFLTEVETGRLLGKGH